MPLSFKNFNAPKAGAKQRDQGHGCLVTKCKHGREGRGETETWREGTGIKGREQKNIIIMTMLSISMH